MHVGSVFAVIWSPALGDYAVYSGRFRFELRIMKLRIKRWVPTHIVQIQLWGARLAKWMSDLLLRYVSQFRFPQEMYICMVYRYSCWVHILLFVSLISNTYNHIQDIGESPKTRTKFPNFFSLVAHVKIQILNSLDIKK